MSPQKCCLHFALSSTPASLFHSRPVDRSMCVDRAPSSAGAGGFPRKQFRQLNIREGCPLQNSQERTAGNRRTPSPRSRAFLSAEGSLCLESQLKREHWGPSTSESRVTAETEERTFQF
ncbi:unnamed protein product [Rangifer tarandus platyrhynchus]|uniref:Uncharacterized protein n=2 Tax=Rangifer tarandus platyrhynchus TaxID=3082113 RepID=A0AC60A532_RANTA|nr:unnamed protein product [Rangifer tarandus platyrhynchus]